MKCTLAVLADYANVTQEKKLNIMGIFSILYAPDFPVQHSTMQLVMHFVAGIAEREREKTIEIQLMDEDGKKVLNLRGKMPVGNIKPGELFTANQIVTLENMRFEKPGMYRFDIFIDNQPAAEVPLRVQKLIQTT